MFLFLVPRFGSIKLGTLQKGHGMNLRVDLCVNSLYAFWASTVICI